jgi:hypothetical protein
MKQFLAMELGAAIGDLFSAVFNGAPDQASAEKYTAQITAVISLYIVFVAAFLVGLYVRSVKASAALQAERKTFRVWIAYSLLFSILMIAGYLGYFLVYAT